MIVLPAAERLTTGSSVERLSPDSQDQSISGDMNEITIWFDESGFTGEDLVNAEQRHFTLASSIICDQEAEAILRDCFPRFAGSEFKFSALWRGTRHRPGMLRFSAMLPKLADRIFIYVIDKRFSLLIKLVDYLIEPLVWASGYDFYRNAYARKFVNHLHADLLRHGSPKLYNDTINAWSRLARSPSGETFSALKSFLTSNAQSLTPPLSSFYGLAARGAEHFLGPGERIEDFVMSNEIQVTAMLNSVSHWRSIRSETFNIVHDESTSFAKSSSTWEALIRGDMEPFEAVAASGQVSFPLRVASSRSERSERSYAIQLCDLLAGMLSLAVRNSSGECDPFLIELKKAGLGNATFDGVMPMDEAVTGPLPLRSGPDLLDNMVHVLQPAIKQKLDGRKNL